MSFWKTSAGQEATGVVEEMSFDPLPKGWYTSMLEEVIVDEYEGQKKIKIKARIVGEGFGKNRILYLNLKAFEGDSIKESSRDRAIQVLVKIYAICKAKLPNGEPDDISLSQLIDKPMDLMLDAWEMTKDNGDLINGNWLVNVEARGAKAGTAVAPSPQKKSAPVAAQRQPEQRQEPDFGGMDDDIPF